MSSSRDVLVKSTPLRGVLAFMEKNLSPAAIENVFTKASVEFPEETNRAKARVIVASERFPVVFINRMIELVAGEMKEPVANVAHRMGRAAAENASTGILKLAMVLISMPSLLRKLQPVWAQLYTHGAMSSSSEGKTANIELRDFPVISATGCARITGWFEWFAQAAEKTAKVRHDSCRVDNESGICRWTITW